MHQDFTQVLLVQDEEVGEPVGHHIGGAAVPAPDSQQAGGGEQRGEALRRLRFRLH